MQFLVLVTSLLTLILLLQPIYASDYAETTELPFPINLTILETIGTINDKENNTIGNFTHYILGFEIFLENYSFEIETDPDLGNWSYQYDLAGNLIKQVQNGGGNLVSGDNYYREYDGLNQLIKIRNGTSTSPIVEEYSYDPFGQRIKITRNDTANTTIYTPFKELMRIRNVTGSYDFTYVYQEGILVARVNPDGTKYFYHPDHLGSTTLITDSNGNIIENAYYSPYGELLGGGTADIRLYTNQIKDFQIQYYYGARYYNPTFGMFTQCDPADILEHDIYNPQELNCYSYTLGNPYKYTDPTGRFFFLPFAIGGSALLTYLGIGVGVTTIAYVSAPLWTPVFTGGVQTPVLTPPQPITPITPKDMSILRGPISVPPAFTPSDIGKSPSVDASKTAESSTKGITQASKNADWGKGTFGNSEGNFNWHHKTYGKGMTKEEFSNVAKSFKQRFQSNPDPSRYKTEKIPLKGGKSGETVTQVVDRVTKEFIRISNVNGKILSYHPPPK